MRVVNTDNHGSDYPNEKFVSGTMSYIEAQKLADELNEGADNWTPRWHKVVNDDYELVPGFKP